MRFPAQAPRAEASRGTRAERHFAAPEGARVVETENREVG